MDKNDWMKRKVPYIKHKKQFDVVRCWLKVRRKSETHSTHHWLTDWKQEMLLHLKKGEDSFQSSDLLHLCIWSVDCNLWLWVIGAINLNKTTNWFQLLCLEFHLETEIKFILGESIFMSICVLHFDFQVSPDDVNLRLGVATSYPSIAPEHAFFPQISHHLRNTTVIRGCIFRKAFAAVQTLHPLTWGLWGYTWKVKC